MSDISYKREERAVARKLADALAEQGWFVSRQGEERRRVRGDTLWLRGCRLANLDTPQRPSPGDGEGAVKNGGGTVGLETYWPHYLPALARLFGAPLPARPGGGLMDARAPHPACP